METRDGTATSDLIGYCQELREHARDLAEKLNLARIAEREIDERRRSSALGRELNGLSNAMEGLLEFLPGVPKGTRPVDGRALSLAAVLQWLDRKAEMFTRATHGLHGHTSTVPVASIVEFLASQQKSGILKLEVSDETARIEFVNGDVVHAVSDNSPPGERLGEILVEQGVLDEVVLQTMLTKQSRSGLRMGELLASEGVVPTEILKHGLEKQVRMLFQRVFQSHDGYFEFIEASALREVAKVRLKVLPLLLEVATAADEHARDAERCDGAEQPQEMSEAIQTPPEVSPEPESIGKWRGRRIR